MDHSRPPCRHSRPAILPLYGVHRILSFLIISDKDHPPTTGSTTISHFKAIIMYVYAHDTQKSTAPSHTQITGQCTHTPNTARTHNTNTHNTNTQHHPDHRPQTRSARRSGDLAEPNQNPTSARGQRTVVLEVHPSFHSLRFTTWV